VIRTIYTVVRVRLVNGRTLWVKEVVEDDDDWRRATSSRGRRDLLLSGSRMKAIEAAERSSRPTGG
jgi:hypothetical protein